MIAGMTIRLYDKVKTGEDDFGRPIYELVTIDVDDVLVGEPSSEEVIDTLDLTGKHLAYTLAIPKGDTNVWTDRIVEFFGGKFKTIGEPIQGIEANIPLRWHKKVKVERYE